MRIASITIALLLIAVANAAKHDAYAQSPKPQTTRGVGPTGTPCLFDFERGEIPNCVRESANGDLFIVPEFLKELRFDSHGLAVVRSAREGWMYISRTGKVLIKGVPVMDNWADSFHDGLVRIIRNGKYGFANREGQVVIPPIYDGAMNFENGHAVVCKGCESRPADREGEYHLFAGGTWFRINTKGKVLGRVPPPVVAPATFR